MKHYPFLDLARVNARYIDALHEAAARVIDSGRYIGGDECEALESDLCSLCSVGHAVGVSTGLDALRLILEAYKAMGRLSEGDEVIVPANTFIASVLAIVHAGLRPVLTDPDETTMNLSGAIVRRALTDRTRVIMPVHLYGRLAWDKEMASLCAEHPDLIVVEDAAQAIGAVSPVAGIGGNHSAGALGHAGAFSFYPTKNVGALGDAGAVVTDDDTLADTVRALANYGSFRRYENRYAGFNCRLDPIQAAMIRVKLADARRAAARRFERAAAYDHEICHPIVIKPEISRGATDQVWHQYVIRIPGHRDGMRRYLSEMGVDTDIHYPTPPHRQPCFSEFSFLSLPVADRLASEVLSLPISDCTSVRDAAEISHIINRFEPDKYPD